MLRRKQQITTRFTLTEFQFSFRYNQLSILQNILKSDGKEELNAKEQAVEKICIDDELKEKKSLCTKIATYLELDLLKDHYYFMIVIGK